MSKDTQKNKKVTPILDVKIPEILKSPKYYQLLISNRWVSYRKELWEDCDECVIPKHGTNIWKHRFTNINLVPKNNFEYLTTVMEEKLIAKIEEQYNYIIDMIEAKQNNITKLGEEIELLKKILAESEIALEKYKKDDAENIA